MYNTALSLTVIPMKIGIHKYLYRFRVSARNDKEKGFTLVELLVAIAIIAILSVIGITLFSGVQKNARISKRIADMKAIQQSLEIYYYANNFTYPATPDPTTGVFKYRGECNYYGALAADNVIPGLVPQYMVSFPSDPTMNKADNKGCYLYMSDGKDYKMLVAFNATDMTSNDYANYPPFVDPRRDGGSNNCIVDGSAIQAWQVSSPDGRCW